MTRAFRKKAEAEVLRAAGEWAKTPLVWGRDDCMLAVADIVLSLTGNDPARRFRGRYRSMLGARRALGKGGTEAAAIDSARALHWKVIHPADALPGDVGLIEMMVRAVPYKTSTCAVICRQRGWFVGRGDRGVVALPAAHVRRAWAIQ